MPEERVLSGRYALREVVGMGGMAIVYKAKDMKLRREVAVKVLRSEFANDAEFVRRFTDEAHAVLQMHHTNIVDIFGLGQDGDTHYIVMEFVNGVTLKELIRQRGPLKPRRAVQMAVRILAAVDHAHKNHIVHRDIKPQNILVNADYHVKVTDFGIARRANAENQAAQAQEKKNVLGSVHYFSPEQASGQTADKTSDLYSVGVVLYEMLTGKVPFDGDTPEEVAVKHVRELPAAPSSIQTEVSKALDEVIARALEKDGTKRYQSAAEMAADLKRALRNPEGGFVGRDPAQRAETVSVLPGTKLHLTKKNLLRAAIILAAAVVVVSGYALLRGLRRSALVRMETPDVLLWHIEEAAEYLDAQNVRYIIEETPEGDERVGTIVAQYPDPGAQMRKDERLTLYVSTGEHSSYVPTLVGMEVHEATARLGEFSLLRGNITYIAGSAAPGDIVAQDPEPGAYVHENTKVDLVVNGESAPVPDCSGLPLEDARILLDVHGFAVGEIIEQISDASPDSVLSQSIAPDTQALLGEKVDLTIARLDREASFRCRAEISFYVPSVSTEVRMTLEDEDGLRTVFLESLGEGSYTKALTILSRTSGAHKLSVYVDGEVVLEKNLIFR